MSGPSPYSFTQYRIESGANGQWQPFVEEEKGKRQADHGIDRPGGQAPMKDGGSQRQTFGFRCHCLDVQRCSAPIGIIGHWFGGTIEQHANSDTGRKQHRNPGSYPEFWLGICPAQTNFTQRRDCDGNTEKQNEVGRYDKKPVEILQRPGFGGFEPLLRDMRVYQGQEYECDNQEGTDEEDRIVHLQPERIHIVLTRFIIGLVTTVDFVRNCCLGSAHS